MKDFRKTTMVKYTDDSTWHVVATRVAATENLEMKSLDKEVEKLCVFLQEPLKDHQDVAFYAEKIFDVDLDGDHIATMGYKQRKKANEGIEEINAIDDAMYVGLKASCQPKRMVGKLGKILCILTTLMSTTAEAEKNAELGNTV